MKHPKLLIFGEGFSDVSGPGLTLTSLFKGWPRDMIMDAHYTSHRDTVVTDQHIFIPNTGMTGLWRKPSPRKNEEAAVTGSTHKGLVVLLRRVLRDYAFMHRIGMAEVVNQMLEYQPELLYVQPGFGFCISILKLHKLLNDIPMAVHIMDDWAGKWSFSHSCLEKLVFKKQHDSLKTIIRKSRARFAICEAMADEYSSRYGLPFTYYQRVVEDDFIPPSNTQIQVPRKIMYVGNVNICISNNLRRISEAVNKINKHSKLVEFSIVTAQRKMVESIGLSEFLDENCPYPNRDIPNVMKTADVLLLPLGFTEECYNYARLSMPSKVPEYLCSGIPCLVFAPKETAISQYATKHNWGVTVTDDNLDKLITAINRLTTDECLRETLAGNALKAFNDYHSSLTIRAKFQNELLCMKAKPFES